MEGIAWDMASYTHLRGLLQQFIAALASAGVLLSAASKNDRVLVEQVLTRRDILLPREKVFPVEAYWGPKSESVGRILKEWNIASDDVVFFDNSPWRWLRCPQCFQIWNA